jgi:hypothetical protein
VIYLKSESEKCYLALLFWTKLLLVVAALNSNSLPRLAFASDEHTDKENKAQTSENFELFQIPNY